MGIDWMTVRYANGTELLPRSLALQGASNVRDIGGWPAADGRTVRFGLVFRSAALGKLTARDVAALAATGLRTVCDLRGVAERRRAPSRLDNIPGLTSHALSIEPSLGASLRDVLATRIATGEDVMSLMRRAYIAYAMDWSHCYRAMFALLLEPTQRPLLFHCTAGKDRTGFGAALVLSAIGVPWEAVREDYMATNRLWRGDTELAALLPAHVADTLLRVHPELLDIAFRAIRAAYGTVDTYLKDRMGLDAPRRDDLRAALLE
jgi:protein-tyrosine phosphatase